MSRLDASAMASAPVRLTTSRPIGAPPPASRVCQLAEAATAAPTKTARGAHRRRRLPARGQRRPGRGGQRVHHGEPGQHQVRPRQAWPAAGRPAAGWHQRRR
jgi:hypothetical protein